MVDSSTLKLVRSSCVAEREKVVIQGCERNGNRLAKALCPLLGSSLALKSYGHFALRTIDFCDSAKISILYPLATKCLMKKDSIAFKVARVAMNQ